MAIAEAMAAARDMVAAVTDAILALPLPEGLPRLGASAGVACFPDDAEAGTELIAAADAALVAWGLTPAPPRKEGEIRLLTFGVSEEMRSRSPVAGESGTLADVFAQHSVAGRLLGKTGTLNGSDPYREYSWFVGFAPIEAPEVAVAGLVYNTERWHIKGAYLASEAIIRLLQR